MYMRVFSSTLYLCYCSTKYLGGHSDLCAGVITCRTVELWQKINAYKVALGSVMVSIECWLEKCAQKWLAYCRQEKKPRCRDYCQQQRWREFETC